jgi:hypothetical protein
MKKAIIITTILLSIGITAFIVLFPGKTEPFYYINPATRLENLPERGAIENAASNYIYPSENAAVVTNEDEDISVVLGLSEDPWVIKTDPKTGGNYSTNYNGSAVAVLVFENDKTAIFYKDENSEYKFTDPNISFVQMADFDNAFYYFTKNRNDKDYTIKLVKDGETKIISNNAFPYSSRFISPDGECISWIEGYDEETRSFRTHLYKDGLSWVLGGNINVCAISNGAERIYFEQYGNLYVQNGYDPSTRIMLAKMPDQNNVYPPGTPWYKESLVGFSDFNYDYTQALIYEIIEGDNTKTILYEDGKEPVVIAEYGLYSKHSEDIDEYAVKDLKNEIYYSDNLGTRYRIDEHLTPYEVKNTETTEALIKYTADGNILYYVNSDGNKTPIDTLIDKHVLAVDGDKAYFIGNENDLFMANNGETSYLYTFPVDSRASKIVTMELLADKYLFVTYKTKGVIGDEYDNIDYYISSDFTNFVNIDDIS